MWVKSNAKNFILAFRIDLGLEMDCEKPEDAYIILREPNTMEMMALNDALRAGQTALAGKMKEQLPAFTVEHNFYETENQKMENDAVIETVYSKAAAAMKVINDYTEKVFSPFLKKKDKK